MTASGAYCRPHFEEEIVIRRRIIFIGDHSLRDTRRGTPIRIIRLLEQISKEHDLWICARDVPVAFEGRFVAYPTGSRLRRLNVFRDLVRQHSIDWVMTATDGSLGAPVALKFLHRVKIAVDLHGIFAEEARATNAIGRLHYMFMKYRVWGLLCFYDRVFPVSEKLTDIRCGVGPCNQPENLLLRLFSKK